MPDQDWSMAQAADTPAVKPDTGKIPLSSLSDIESKLTPIGNDNFNALKADKAPRTQGQVESSAADFADAFEVPKVMGMQKSTRIKKKKRKFFLFRWFSRDND